MVVVNINYVIFNICEQANYLKMYRCKNVAIILLKTIYCMYIHTKCNSVLLVISLIYGKIKKQKYQKNTVNIYLHLLELLTSVDFKINYWYIFKSRIFYSTHSRLISNEYVENTVLLLAYNSLVTVYNYYTYILPLIPFYFIGMVCTILQTLSSDSSSMYMLPAILSGEDEFVLTY